jgi:hypothetical protein
MRALCAPYPAAGYAAQFEKMATGWGLGLAELEIALSQTPAEKQAAVQFELLVARAARLCFKSIANQTRFILARDALADSQTPLTPADRQKCVNEIRQLLTDEMGVAREMFTITRLNSCVGYEAASQYFYLPLDLVEKVFCCQQILEGYPEQ